MPTVLPIACGQTISQPYVVAFMSEHLGVQPSHRVLEVGTGSGYQAAILSRLAREVVSVERYRTGRDRATRLRTLGYDNVDVRVGMASPACRTARPTIGSSSSPPPRPFPTLVSELAEGGVMVLPLGPHAGPQQLIKLTKGEQELNRSL